MADRSLIRRYIVDFFEHLQAVAEHRRRFKRFYPHWERNRKDTIAKLNELLEMLRSTETVCEVGIAVGAIGGVGGALGTLATAFYGTINPAAIAVKCAGHGLKTGFAAGKAAVVSRVRNAVGELIELDFNETAALVEMGLSFDTVIREMRTIVDQIKTLTVSYTLQELMEELRITTTPCIAAGGDGGPHRQLAQTLVQAVHGLDQADARNVSEILTRFVEYNPDYMRAARSLGQTAFDLLGFTRLMNMSVLGTALGFDHLYVAGSMVSMGLDLRDLAQSILNLRAGGSVNQDMVEKVIRRLEQELEWLDSVNRDLVD